ncbi:MAG: endonuclease MutS2 [Ignavibacteriaceae bacterium]
MNNINVSDKLELNKILNYISEYCSTESGKEITRGLLPKENLIDILNEGSAVEEAKKMIVEQDFPPIEYLPDLTPFILRSKIAGAVLTANDILKIKKLSEVSRNLYQYINKSGIDIKLLKKESDLLFVDKVFEHHIRKVINDNAEIIDSASPALKKIRSEINVKKADLVKAINRISKSLLEKGYVQEEYLTLRDGRMVIPVKAEHKRHLKGFIHSESATGQTVYIEPESTLELNNEIVSLSFAEKRETERLLKELTGMIGTYSESLLQSLKTVAYLDSLFARAKYSLEVIGSFPSFNPDEPFTIREARHPLLLKKLGRENTVPLNMTIEDKHVIIITGPNAGGKTVVLKTVGLLCLMAQSGIHIPVHPDSNFQLFRKILVDIGDEQSIEDDLSTFSSHLKNIKTILESADNSSLVLLDEIGTGTDPAEGASLATAVLVELAEKKSVVLATTHHGSLKLIANEFSNFENAAMQFDHKNLTPTYVFKQGIPGSSYAFEIAGRSGFDQNILEKAKFYLDSDKHNLEKFLVEIEARSQSLSEELRIAEKERTRLKELTSQFQIKIQQLKEEEKKIIRNAKLEAKQYLASVNKTIENLIKEIRETEASKTTIKSVHRTLNKLKAETEETLETKLANEGELADFKVGDYVKIKNTSSKGKILMLDMDRRKAVLEVGKIKMQAKLDELDHTDANFTETAERQQESSFHPAEYRLDIRGYRAGEVELKVLKFVDDAYISGLERIEILHGKGSGALKKIVSELLSGHDKVKNFYFAPIESGGEGITIVEIK